MSQSKLHPRNPHAGRYDFEALCKTTPALTAFVRANPKGDNTIDFADSEAVLCLNKALLAHFYQVKHWQIPPDYLCPPIPGRADYIHYLADLLKDSDIEPKGKQVKVLDIGTGANCIYPIIGSRSYGWQFTASDIDPVSVNVAQLIVKSNPCLNKSIKVRLQQNAKAIFDGIIKTQDRFDLTMCNPPFYGSIEEAIASNARKTANLGKGRASTTSGRNFGGQKAELWCEGGELAFLTQMIRESKKYHSQVGWFTSLVSNKQNLKPLKQQLAQYQCRQIKIVDMAQGQKVSRFIAWAF